MKKLFNYIIVEDKKLHNPELKQSNSYSDFCNH